MEPPEKTPPTNWLVMPAEHVTGWHAARAIKAKRSKNICVKKNKVNTLKKKSRVAPTLKTHTHTPSKPQPIKEQKGGKKEDNDKISFSIEKKVAHPIT